MTINRGMLGGLVPVQDGEAELEDLHRWQARDPFSAMARASYAGGSMAGEGLGRLAAVATGNDPRTRGEQERDLRRGALDAVRASVKGLQPGSDEFYGAIVKALSENGMVDQAAQAQAQWDNAKMMKARTGAYERQGTPKPPAPLKGKDFLLAKFDDLTAKLAEDPENPELQKALTNVQTALKTFYPDAKKEQTGEWRIVQPTQDSPGYQWHTGTGERKTLDGRIQRPATGRGGAAGNGNMPATIVKTQNDLIEDLSVASNIKADLGGLVGQLDRGEIDLGPLKNLWSGARNMAGISSEQSRKYATLNATLQKLRNDSLRLNKGTQTEGDAQRAWNELLANINDPKLVRDRLVEIQAINERAVATKKAQINTLRAEYKLDPLDTSSVENVKPAVGVGDERIRVRRKSDGKVGTISRSAFNPQKYDKVD